MLKDLTLDFYLEKLASGDPTPGGGAAAALTLAQAAALISMVCNFTLGREKYRESEVIVNEILGDAETVRAEALEAVDSDAIAFEAVCVARKMPRGTTEEQQKRDCSIQNSVEQAAAI